MKPAEVFDLIKQVAATSSKTAKEQLLKPALADEFFSRVMRYAYDPFKTYGLRMVPEGQNAGIEGWTLDEPSVWNILDELANRNLTGDAARDMVQSFMDNLDPASAALLWRIIRKDMRAGFSESTLNKLSPGLIPEFPYMRCSLPDKTDISKWPWDKGVISQIKADGMFANVNHDEHGNVWITSRQGSPFPLEALGPLAAHIAATLTPGTQTHGELLVDNEGIILPREQGNGVLNSVLQGGTLPDQHRVLFFAWDQIPLSAVKPKGKHPTPYKERLRALLRQIHGRPEGAVKLIETTICMSRAQAFQHYRQALQSGQEGTIIKHPEATWKDGTSKEQIKLKLEVDVDLKVVGFVPGEGKNAATFGSVLCQTSCGGLEVAVSGFSDDMRAQIHAKRDEVLETIMTVRFNSIMSPKKVGDKYSLFLPRYVEFRSDKSEADSLQRVREQFDAKIAA